MSANSESKSESQRKLQVYSLVRFVHRGPRKQVEDIDIVPSKWLDLKQDGKCITKFMAAPYNNEDLKLIHTLVINNVGAPEDWPTFSVEIVGQAETYDDGLKKIERLAEEDNVLSLDSEESASEVQKDLTEAVKRQKLLAEASQLHTKFSLKQNKENRSDNTKEPIKSFKRQKKDDKVDERVSCTPPKTNDGALNKIVEKGAPSGKTMSCVSSGNTTKSTSNQTPLLTDENKAARENDTSQAQASPPKSVPTTFEQTLEIGNVFIHDLFNDTPIFDLEDIAFKSGHEAAVLMRLNKIGNDVTSIKKNQEIIIDALDQVKSAQEAMANYLFDKKIVRKSATDFEKKYQLTLPISTMDAFELFDNRLKTDKYLKNDVYLELRSLVDSNFVISKSIVKMLKNFLTKDMANQFTAIRSSSINKSKIKFKPTEFCKLIDATITKMRGDISLKTDPEELASCLTDVLSNVSRWK